MRVPFEWLKEYVTMRLSPEALAERLTMVGLEVTAIEQVEGEPVLNLEITPNRADCLSIIGVAREVAALTSQPLKPPSDRRAASPGGTKPASSRPTAQALRAVVRIDDRHGCEHYIGRLIKEVRVASSPAWMQRRLVACGVRPINNVVDVTNYVLLEYGQPLHAFDFDRLSQGTLRVRRAQAGESLTTLDGVARSLSADMLVIADAAVPIAVAGVMGGTGSEVTLQTRTLLVESALFDPVTVRRTARKLGLASESSYRFERGVDPQGVETASARAATLILELAGGEEAACYDVGAKPLKRVGVLVDAGRASRWLGTPLSPTAIRTILAKLSCHVASSEAGGALHVGVPSFRRDLTQEVDLYEEVARAIGYDRLPSTIPIASLTLRSAEETASYVRAQSLRGLCASLGLTEAITWSLIAADEAAAVGCDGDGTVRVANPLSQDHAIVRPSLLAGLLQALRRNLSRGRTDIALFEVGRVVRAQGRIVPENIECLQLGVVLSGRWFPDWTGGKTPCSFWLLKGLLSTLVRRFCGCELQTAHATHAWSDSGQSAAVYAEGRVVGVAGKLSRKLREACELSQDAWYAELAVGELEAIRRAPPPLLAPAAFPPVKRDVSIILDDRVAFDEVARTIREAAGALADRIELIDRFTGAPVPPGKHSLTFAIEYRDPSRTLTAAEADAAHQRIAEALTSRCGAALR